MRLVPPADHHTNPARLHPGAATGPEYHLLSPSIFPPPFHTTFRVLWSSIDISVKRKPHMLTLVCFSESRATGARTKSRTYFVQDPVPATLEPLADQQKLFVFRDLRVVGTVVGSCPGGSLSWLAVAPPSLRTRTCSTCEVVADLQQVVPAQPRSDDRRLVLSPRDDISRSLTSRRFRVSEPAPIFASGRSCRPAIDIGRLRSTVPKHRTSLRDIPLPFLPGIESRPPGQEC